MRDSQPKLKWSYSPEYNGTTLTIKHSVSVTGDRVSGDETVDSFGVTGDFIAIRTRQLLIPQALGPAQQIDNIQGELSGSVRVSDHVAGVYL